MVFCGKSAFAVAIGVKRTSLIAAHMSANDPKRTLACTANCYTDGATNPATMLLSPGVDMRRRGVPSIFALGRLWVRLAARAQQHAPPVVGFVHSQSFDTTGAERVRQFSQGLKDTGYVDKENVTIEARWAEGRYDRLPSLVTELVNRNVSVIAATSGAEPVSAAKKATSAIPIVFITGADPVALGLVTNLSPPEGNLTRGDSRSPASWVRSNWVCCRRSFPQPP